VASATGRCSGPKAGGTREAGGAAVGAVTPGTEPAGREWFPLLERKCNCCGKEKDQKEEEEVEVLRRIPVRKPWVVAKGCRCRWCDNGCGESAGIKIRERLREKIGKEWKSALMLTLTIDPKLFASPKDALLYVRGRRAVSELIRGLIRSGHLKHAEYVVVLEFHQTGWPHWHVLLQAEFVDVNRINQLWGRNRPEWAGQREDGRPEFGWAYVSKRNFVNMEHAANYATKYIVKNQERPVWMETFEGRIPRYSTSRKFWGGDGEEDEQETLVEEAKECQCVWCRGEIPLPPVGEEFAFSQLTMGEEDWRAFGADSRSHRVGKVDGGRERRIFWKTRPIRERRKMSTIGERLDHCCEAGAVMVEKITQTVNGRGELVQTSSKFAFLGCLNVPYVEFCEEFRVEGRRSGVTWDDAERLCGRKWFGLRPGVESPPAQVLSSFVEETVGFEFVEAAFASPCVPGGEADVWSQAGEMA
jgi:hypothetical protein